MKNGSVTAFLTLILLSVTAVFGQQTIVLNDPLIEDKLMSISAANESLIKRQVLPKARKYWTKDGVCEEDFAFTGAANGSFSKPNAKQTLVFYQFCQTGNGFGNNGLVLLEDGKIVASYISEAGWALNLKSMPDVNQNGLDEFLVYYSGGLHQGGGGTGADVMEFSGMNVKAIGWLQASTFTEDDSFAYKVFVKPGKSPIFYREKYVSIGENKWKKSGKLAKIALEKPFGKFTVLK